MAVSSRVEYRFSWWHQGVFLFDRLYVWAEDWPEYEEATTEGAVFGQSRSRGVTFISPGGSTFGADGARLVVEVYDQDPELPLAAGSDTVGEFDLDAISGDFALEESGGGTGDSPAVLGTPPGRFRARWSGFGEEAVEVLDREGGDEDAERPDSYLLQIWPRTTDTEIAVLRTRE
ncbi:hypothetical protein DSM112329_02881 [Paraconexibacter sp. AEG42_29]|uniref:Uncharacterized protein n=1 Tax=Paraconexibacter sp. AEG42_29 TaxID=2997339 RepID=A0AAU7AWE9_9ACTN